MFDQRMKKKVAEEGWTELESIKKNQWAEFRPYEEAKSIRKQHEDVYGNKRNSFTKT